MTDFMNVFRPALLILALLWLASAPASAAPYSPTLSAGPNRTEAQRTCHHVRQTSRRHCTRTALLRKDYAQRLYYPRRYYGTTHYNYPFAYYGYRPYGFYRGLYRPYWYRSPFWY
jgi:hypothetical protein